MQGTSTRAVRSDASYSLYEIEGPGVAGGRNGNVERKQPEAKRNWSIGMRCHQNSRVVSSNSFNSADTDKFHFAAGPKTCAAAAGATVRSSYNRIRLFPGNLPTRASMLSVRLLLWPTREKESMKSGKRGCLWACNLTWKLLLQLQVHCDDYP